RGLAADDDVGHDAIRRAADGRHDRPVGSAPRGGRLDAGCRWTDHIAYHRFQGVAPDLMKEHLLARLAPGLRRLEDDGRVTGESAQLDVLDGHSSLFVVDLEMSGPNAQMHEVLDVGGVRARLDVAIPEEEAWGARIKPKHIGNAVPGALKVVGYTPKAWKTALDLEAAFERFATLGRDAVITGWGIGQDMAFLVETFRRLGQPW